MGIASSIEIVLVATKATTIVLVVEMAFPAVVHLIIATIVIVAVMIVTTSMGVVPVTYTILVGLVELLVEVKATVNHKPTELLARLAELTQVQVVQAETERPLVLRVQLVPQELTEITQMVLLDLLVVRLGEL